MTTLPRFSIVTPSLNQIAYIGEALWSVRAQRYPEVEHIVMDGASTDGTVDLLRSCSDSSRWPHLRWSSGRDRGQSNALNKGFARAQGDIVGWLNSDDRYRPGCFEYIAKAFAANPGVDIIYGDSTWMDATGKVFRIRREIAFSRFILLYHKILFIPTTSVFFRRRIVEDGNLLDEGLHFAMDYDFFVRLALRGYTFKHVPRLLADFRFHPASKSSIASDQQMREQDEVVQRQSPLLRQLKSTPVRQAALAAMRGSAALLRYSEKAIRGYYFDSLRVATIDRNTQLSR